MSPKRRRISDSPSQGPSHLQLAGILTEFARTMVTDFPIQAILDRLVERIVEILPITGAGVTLIDPGTEPHYIAASDTAALRFEMLQSELGEGPCVTAYRTGEPVAVPDMYVDARFPRFSSRAVAAGLAAAFTFPLRSDKGAIGALDLYRDTPGPLDNASMDAAQTLADVAAAYLLNAQAREHLQLTSDQALERSLHDALTGLPNRVLLLERIAHAALRSTRSGSATAVLFIDLDRFKKVNDSFGHGVGDGLLRAVAQQIKTAIRPGDTLARLSGDEFVVVCEDLESHDEANMIAGRIHIALGSPFDIAGSLLPVSVSIGIAFSEADGQLPEQLLVDADAAMYEAKRGGGGLTAPASTVVILGDHARPAGSGRTFATEGSVNGQHRDTTPGAEAARLPRT